LKELSTLVEVIDPSQKEAAAALLDLAVRECPSDENLLWEAARKFEELEHWPLTLKHYQRLLAINPEHAAASNNAGVAAQNWHMPIAGVRYYRRSQELGVPVATANIAQLLIRAGFVKEAKHELESVRDAEEDKENVLTAYGDIARAEKHEAVLQRNAEELAENYQTFLREMGIARVERVEDPASLSGAYAGAPSPLLLSVDGSGNVFGHFSHAEGKRAIMQGALKGRVIEFRWDADTSDALSPLLASFDKKSGHGTLIVRDDGTLIGFFQIGERRMTATAVEVRTAWSVSKAVPQPRLGTGEAEPEPAPVARERPPKLRAIGKPKP
jgi:hypothetical protein